MLWNNSTGAVTFNVYASSDWTGTAAMTMTRTPVFTSGFSLVGLDIGARMTASNASVTLGNVQFDDGSGFVDVDTAEATYATSASFHNNYHALSGTLGSFTFRGTALFPTGTTSGDGMRFFIDGRQALQVVVPLPPAAWAGLGSVACVAGFGVIRRRRMSAV